MDVLKSFCVQCGFNVDIDDDGCCVQCGSTAVGDGVGYIEDLRARLDSARELLGIVVDDDKCYYDHHGYCQTHGWFDKSECYMKRIRKWLAEGRGGVR